MLRVGRIAGLIIAVGLFGACGNSSGAPLDDVSKMNMGEIAVESYLWSHAFFCGGDQNILNIQYGRAGEFGNYVRHYQVSNPKYDVVENELTAAERQNGVVFAGWIEFDADTTVRRRQFDRRHGWLKWTDWESMHRADLAPNSGHYIEFRNGVWSHTPRGYQTLPGARLMRDLMSAKGLDNPQPGTC